MPSAEFELIIQDNSELRAPDSWLASGADDARLRYEHTDEPLPMTVNYERAVERAQGEYVCVIGDDDGVNPDILNAVKWARRESIDAVIPENSAHFVWPDLRLPGRAIQPGELLIRSFSGDVSSVDVADEVRKCARAAAQHFYRLPRSYYGIVRRECLRRLRDLAGVCFPGVSPDMASAVALCRVVERASYINYPLFLPGSSFNSNAGLSGLNRHVGRLDEQRHLPRKYLQAWSHIVPRFYSVQTVWAESFVTALAAIGRSDLLPEFNVARLYAECLFFHRGFALETLRAFRGALESTEQTLAGGTGRMLSEYGYLWGLRVRSFIKRRAPRWQTPPAAQIAHRESGIPDIGEAVRALGDYLEASGNTWSSLPLSATRDDARGA